jgi:hypothetical protein
MKNDLEKFNQLCVWSATIVGKEEIKNFEQFFLDSLGVSVKYECEIKTLPEVDSNGNAICDTGDRNDTFFYIHDKDIQKFAIPRLKMGIRWWEDVIKYNDNSHHLYSSEFILKYPTTW